MEIRAWAESILGSDSLSTKLYFPAELSDHAPGQPCLVPDFPSRPLALRPRPAERQSGPSRLDSSRQRGLALHYFANHELLAIELMALALLRFPAAPAGLRRAIAGTLRDEQRHLSLYQGRMEALGVSFGELPVNEYFWRSLSGMNSPEAYLAGMSLTFEQANLDHAQYFIRAFRAVGDEETAALLQVVHEDEISHVRVGADWLGRIAPPETSLWEQHQALLPWPLTPRRAKGKVYCRESRRAVGFSADYIEDLGVYSHSRGRRPDIYWFNSDCELEIAHGRGYTPAQKVLQLMGDLELLPLLFASSDDILLLRRQPAREHLQSLQACGLALPEVVLLGNKGLSPELLRDRPLGKFRPWGHSPATFSFAAARQSEAQSPWAESLLATLYPKPWIMSLRAAWRDHCAPAAKTMLGAEILEGAVCRSAESVRSLVRDLCAQWQRPVVLKAPYGASGQNALRILAPALNLAEEAWLERILGQHGTVLVEPWVERLFDFSALLRLEVERPEPVLGLSHFYTDQRGQYLGHVLGKALRGLPAAAKAALCRRQQGAESLQDLMLAAASFVGQYLGERSYLGPAGLDMFVFKDPLTGEPRLRAIGELNPRHTMGHIALALTSKLTQEAQGFYRIIGQRELRSLGLADCRALAALLRQEMPLRQAADGRWQSGAVILTDPSTAVAMLAVVLLGPLPPALSALALPSP